MPRKIPVRPPRPTTPPSHPFLPPGLQLKRSLVRRPRSSLESTPQKQRPPKIVALDAASRIPISRNPIDQTRRLARIEQIKQLYSPREFKRLRDQQLQLALPESPLKTVQGRIKLSFVLWIYFSILVWPPHKHKTYPSRTEEANRGVIGFMFAVSGVFVHEETT